MGFLIFKNPSLLVDESHLSTVEISWLTSKVEEASNTTEIDVKIED